MTVAPLEWMALRSPVTEGVPTFTSAQLAPPLTLLMIVPFLPTATQMEVTPLPLNLSMQNKEKKINLIENI